MHVSKHYLNIRLHRWQKCYNLSVCIFGFQLCRNLSAVMLFLTLIVFESRLNYWCSNLSQLMIWKQLTSNCCLFQLREISSQIVFFTYMVFLFSHRFLLLGDIHFLVGNDNNWNFVLFLVLVFSPWNKTSSEWGGGVIETATLAHVGVSQLTRRKEWRVSSKSSNRNRLKQGACVQDFLVLSLNRLKLVFLN